MIGYKLFRVRKDGSLGSLFIDRTQRLVPGTTYRAKAHRTEGYAFRPGFHVLPEPNAPHLSTRGRKWFKVIIDDYKALPRPASQGGTWYLAKRMQILEAA